MSIRSPTLTTSSIRKWTMLLPSVFDGTCMISTGSSLKYSFFCTGVGVVRPCVFGVLGATCPSAPTSAEAPRRTR